jgi:hypothetical protein
MSCQLLNADDAWYFPLVLLWRPWWLRQLWPWQWGKQTGAGVESPECWGHLNLKWRIVHESKTTKPLARLATDLPWTEKLPLQTYRCLLRFFSLPGIWTSVGDSVLTNPVLSVLHGVETWNTDSSGDVQLLLAKIGSAHPVLTRNSRLVVELTFLRITLNPFWLLGLCNCNCSVPARLPGGIFQVAYKSDRTTCTCQGLNTVRNSCVSHSAIGEGWVFFCCITKSSLLVLGNFWSIVIIHFEGSSV